MISSYNSVSNGYFKSTNMPVLIICMLFSVFYLIIDFGIPVTAVVIAATVLIIIAALTEAMADGTLIIAKQNVYLCIIMCLIIFNIRSMNYVEEQPFYLWGLLICVFSSFFIKQGKADRYTAIKILLCSSLFVVCIVLLSRLLPDVYGSMVGIISATSRDYSIWVMNNGYSGSVGQSIGMTTHYVVVGFAILLGKYYKNKNPKCLLFCAFWFFALVLTGRRSELIAVAIALLVVEFIRGGSVKKISIIGSVVIVMIGLIIVFQLILSNAITYTGENRIINTLFQLAQGTDVSNGRSVLYKRAWELFAAHPLFGIGWGGFREYSHTIIIQVSNVHNIYLQLLCEIGIIGCLVFLVCFLLLGVEIYKSFKDNRANDNIEIVTFPMFMFIYYLAVGLLDNAIYHDEFWLLFSVIMLCSIRLEGKNA